jgi:hypothetical protein
MGTDQAQNMNQLQLLFEARDLLGPDFMKTFIWNDPMHNYTTLVKLGYSISEFSYRLTIPDTQRVERTWRTGFLMHSKDRPKDSKKKLYLLESIERQRSRIVLNHGDYRLVYHL